MKSIYLLFALISTINLAACGQQKSSPAKVQDTARSKPVREDLVRKIPEPVGWINDYAFLFSAEEVRMLDSLLQYYERKTTVEIAVLTVDSTRTNARDFDEFASLIGRTWGVGKKETNNGIVIIIAPDIRRIRINNGLGIEIKISNEETQSIIDKVIIPQFKDGKFYEGTKQGIIALMEKLGYKN